MSYEHLKPLFFCFKQSLTFDKKVMIKQGVQGFNSLLHVAEYSKYPINWLKYIHRRFNRRRPRGTSGNVANVNNSPASLRPSVSPRQIDHFGNFLSIRPAELSHRVNNKQLTVCRCIVALGTQRYGILSGSSVPVLRLMNTGPFVLSSGTHLGRFYTQT